MAKAPKYMTVKPKAKVTAPRTYDPGKGRPQEHLSYLNKDEMKALRRMNGNNMERGPKGLPSFPPADAMGSSSKASSSSKSSSASKNTGPGGGMMGGSGSGGSSRTSPSSGGGSGAGRQGGGNGPSGGMMGGSGSGGSSRTSPSGGGSGAGRQGGGGGPGGGMMGGSGSGGSSRTSPSKNAGPGTGGGGKGNKGDLGVAGVPGGAGRFGGPQARNGSLGNTAPSGNNFGPRSGIDKTAGTVTPSSMAAQNTLNRIASGSSVIGRQNLNKIQDQVPKDPTKTWNSEVKYGQPATVKPRTENIFEGANSLLADPSNQYGLNDAYDPLGSIRTPRREANVAYDPTKSPTTPQQMRNMQDVSSIYGPGMAGVPTPNGRAYSASQQAVPTTKYQDRISPSYDQTVMKNVPYNNGIPDMGVRKTTNAYTAPAVASQPAPVTAYGPTIANPSDPYGIRYAKTASYLGQVPQVREPVGQPYGAAMPQSPAPSRNAAVMPSGSYFGSPSFAPGQGNISPANTSETAAEQTVREAPVQDMGQYSPTVQKMMDPIANWAADKLNTRVAPSQQDSALVRADQALARAFGTPGPDSAYARAMANAANRGSGGSGNSGMQAPSQPSYMPPPVSPVAATPAPPALPPLPPYVNYQQLPDYSNYGSMPASQPVMDFINGYGGGVAGYADGGAVEDGGMSFADKLNWGLKNAPSNNPFFQIAYALGMPSFKKGSGGNDGWHQRDRDMRMEQMLNGTLPASKPKAPAAPAPSPGTSELYPQLSQYEMPPPSSAISQYNNGADVLGQQNQLFRLPEKRGGGVGDGIDAAIRIAKSFS